jgi:hypothetical protein
MGFEVRKVVDTVHGECDGTPYHWRVYRRLTDIPGPDGKLYPAEFMVAAGQCMTKCGADSFVDLWAACILLAGPGCPVVPNRIGKGKKWQYRNGTGNCSVKPSLN